MSTPQYHLLFYSDCEGYYVPIDFPDAIVDERVLGEVIGSTYPLMDELLHIAPHLGIQLNDGKFCNDAAEELSNQIVKNDAGDYAAEKMVWFALFDATEQSIEYKTAMPFG